MTKEKVAWQNPSLRVIDGGKDQPFEVRLREEISGMDEEIEGIITDEEFRTEFADRVMDNTPQTPYDVIESRIDHKILSFFHRKKYKS